MRSNVVLIGLFALTAMLAVAAPAGATMVVALPDFESTTYTAGQTVVGQDGWNEYLLANGSGDSSANEMITPTTTPASESRHLEGDQSLALFNNDTTYPFRSLDAGISFEVGTTIAWTELVDATSGAGRLFLSHNSAGAKTDMGVDMVAGANFLTNGVTNSVDSGVAVATNHKYLLEMVMTAYGTGEAGNYGTTFEAFATDLTAGGARTSLGTNAVINSDLGRSPTAAEMASFQWLLGTGTSGGNNVVLFDTGAPVPEPSAIALLTMGLIGLLAYAWRKRK